MKIPLKLYKRLEKRKNENALRQLPGRNDLIDFYSNDYLGLAASEDIYQTAGKILKDQCLAGNGATGSRLLSGNNKLYSLAEDIISGFHNSEAALIFNSGYDANLGFFSAVPLRGDIILYDELVHASIRDGISMSHAKAFKFRHNNIKHITEILERDHNLSEDGTFYVVTESIFSMDGDQADLQSLTKVAAKYNCHLVVDEAHATGVYGRAGRGLVQELQIEDLVFARIHTFGKALGCHGAAILGSKDLINYLVNFARSFIYTTGLPPHNLATILAVYEELQKSAGIEKKIRQLKVNIDHFKKSILLNNLQDQFIVSDSAIQCCIVSGNDRVKDIARKFATEGFEVKPILSPTVPQGKERLRFCIHSYNSLAEIDEVLKLLAIFINE